MGRQSYPLRTDAMRAHSHTGCLMKRPCIGKGTLGPEGRRKAGKGLSAHLRSCRSEQDTHAPDSLAERKLTIMLAETSVGMSALETPAETTRMLTKEGSKRAR